jgi:hypothetical protein
MLHATIQFTWPLGSGGDRVSEARPEFARHMVLGKPAQQIVLMASENSLGLNELSSLV